MIEDELIDSDVLVRLEPGEKGFELIDTRCALNPLVLKP